MASWRGWVAAAALLAGGAAGAQGASTEADEAAEETGEAARETGEAARQTGEAAGAAAQEAARETTEAAQGTGEAAGAAARDAARETGEAAEQAAGAAGQEAARAEGAMASSNRPLAERCEALLYGDGADASAELRSQCAALLRTRSGGAGVGREQPSAGQDVAAAFGSAGRELVGQGRSGPLGMRGGGPVRNTFMTNPLGWFSGLGVNATYTRAFERYDKLSWVGQARYSRTNASNGNVTAFGVGGGADFFIFGRNNEGLRIGPRVSAAFGTEDFGGTSSFGRLGLSGELGYNFIASNGVSAAVAGGVGGRIAGDSQNEQFESFTGGEFGPYLQLGLGYSW